MTIKTVVADDEPLARERIRRLLTAEPDLQIVGECRNGAEVLEVLSARETDLLLLDVQMPGLSGFDAGEALGQRSLPPFVFVSAHDSYAVQAFEINAVDFLV